MADTTEGQTDSPTQTVEPQEDLDQVGLAELLKDTLEREEQPEPQPTDAENESEGSEPSVEPSVSAEEEPDNDLSQNETTEAAADEVEEDADESGLPADIQESVNKRIGKEVKKRKALKEESEAEITELRQQLEEAKESGGAEEFQPTMTKSNPFAALDTVEKVQKEFLQAEQTLEWAEDNPEGAYLEVEGGEKEFTAEDIRVIRRKSARALRRELPEQLGYIQARDHLEPQALEAFPWWKDKASSDYQNAMQVLRAMPDLARFPDYKFVVGDYLAGREIREASPKAKGKKAKEVKKAPPQPTASAEQPAPVNPETVRSAFAKKAFQESGGVDELANIIKLDL